MKSVRIAKAARSTSNSVQKIPALPPLDVMHRSSLPNLRLREGGTMQLSCWAKSTEHLKHILPSLRKTGCHCLSGPSVASDWRWRA